MVLYSFKIDIEVNKIILPFIRHVMSLSNQIIDSLLYLFTVCLFEINQNILK